MPALAVTSRRAVARPLKVLVPLIKAKLEAIDRFGLEEKRDTGEMLIEAKEQMPFGGWGQWLRRHFHLSERTAQQYMRLARHSRSGSAEMPSSLADLTGDTERKRRARAASRSFRKAAREMDAELFATERQTQAEEIDLCRALALQLIDLGYKAMAIRLHPDRGGSKDAMVRLVRVRDELKQVAAKRRFDDE